MLRDNEDGLLFRACNPVEASVCGDGLNHVLHVYHREWWGIRSATEALPGWKLAISAYDAFEPGNLARMILARSFRTIVFQGYSSNAADLAGAIHAISRGGLSIHVVTHVAVSQFDNQFEIEMISLMIAQQRRGILKKLFSVKAGFSAVCEAFEGHLIINTAPEWQHDVAGRYPGSALVPLTRGLRKNMQANHIALCTSSYDLIFSTLDDAELGLVVDDRKVQYLGHIPQKTIQRLMASVGLVMNVTLTECQPMVFNEAAASGTPCLTGPLFLPFGAESPLRKLTEVADPNDISLIRAKAEAIKDIWHGDAEELIGICKSYHDEIIRLSAESYAFAFGD